MNTAENGIYQKVSDYLESQGFVILDIGIWDFSIWVLKGSADLCGIRVFYNSEDPRWVSITPVDTFGESDCQTLSFNALEVSGDLKIYLDQLIFMCKEFQRYTENG